MHLTTIFPEVRLKRYMEMRGSDGGPEDMINALPAFWVGLLYDRCAFGGPDWGICIPALRTYTRASIDSAQGLCVSMLDEGSRSVCIWV